MAELSTMRAHTRHTLNAKLFGSHFWCPIQTCFCHGPPMDERGLQNVGKLFCIAVLLDAAVRS